MNPYETDRILSEYLLFHYGEAEDILPYPFGPHNALHFPARCVIELLPLANRFTFDCALDIGCAVGRSSFEMTRFARHVTGIDFSQRFIETAKLLQQGGEIDFHFAEAGHHTRKCIARVPADIDRSRVEFMVGDAQSLPETLDGADLVLAANLICRLHEPMSFFARLSTLVKKGGIFLLYSPYTWLEDYTPVDHWLGAKHPHDLTPFEVIREALLPSFDLLGTRDLSFLIREHARKYQWSVSHGSVWRRK